MDLRGPGRTTSGAVGRPPTGIASETRRGALHRVRHGLVGLGVVAALGWSGHPASAGAHPGADSSSPPGGCQSVAYTADGGYFSAGHFYWEPGDDVTLTTDWCYADGVITSDSESYTTTIPGTLTPRITTDDSLVKKGTILSVRLYGAYASNVINNTGDIGIAGYVTGHGRHHFANASGAGG